MWNVIFYVRLETQLELVEEGNQFLGIIRQISCCVFLVIYIFLFCRMLYGEQAKYYEAEQVPILKHTKPGLLSMVNVGDNM